MADRWFLRNQQGQAYELNSTFSAHQYEPGDVDTSSLSRREGHRLYQRSGDGLRTPGPLVLRGRVWRDDRDLQAIWSELEAIEAAVQSCVTIERRTSRTRTTYEDLAGGPTIEIRPDGIGGYTVEAELWPGRAQPTILPVITPNVHIAAFVDGTTGMDNDRSAIVAALNILKARLDAEVYHGTIDDFWSVSHTPSGNDGERWLHYAAQPTGDDVLILAIFNDADPLYHHVPRDRAIEPTPTFLTDYASWMASLDASTRRRCILYGIAFRWQSTEDHYQAFKGHVDSAIHGGDGYPEPLTRFGVEARMEAPTLETAEYYADDLWRLIF